MFKICELWTVILWYELNPRVRCAFGNVCTFFHHGIIKEISSKYNQSKITPWMTRSKTAYSCWFSIRLSKGWRQWRVRVIRQSPSSGKLRTSNTCTLNFSVFSFFFVNKNRSKRVSQIDNLAENFCLLDHAHTVVEKINKQTLTFVGVFFPRI